MIARRYSYGRRQVEQLVPHAVLDHARERPPAIGVVTDAEFGHARSVPGSRVRHRLLGVSMKAAHVREPRSAMPQGHDTARLGTWKATAAVTVAFIPQVLVSRLLILKGR